MQYSPNATTSPSELTRIEPAMRKAVFNETFMGDAEERSLLTATRAYQGLTIAAMLLLLASLWVF